MLSESLSFLSAGDSESGSLCRVSDNREPSRATNLNTENLVGISLGCAHCVAVYNDGSVFGWGNNMFSITGIPSVSFKHERFIIHSPTRISGLPPIMKAKCGCNFTLFLSQNNEIFIATDNYERTELIEKIPTTKKCVSIFGYANPWVVLEDNSIYEITNFHLQTRKMKEFKLPKTAKSREIKDIVSQKSITLCLTESGETFGLDNKATNFFVIKDLEDQIIKKIARNDREIIALTEDGNLFSVGNNKTRRFEKIKKFSDFDIVDVGLNFMNPFFVDSGGNVWTARWNKEGNFSPEKLSLSEKAVAVSCGWTFTFIQIGGSPIIDNWSTQKQIQTQPQTQNINLPNDNNEITLEEKYEKLLQKYEYLKQKYNKLKNQKNDSKKKSDILIKTQSSNKEAQRLKEIEFLNDETLQNLKKIKKIGRGGQAKVVQVAKQKMYALKILNSIDSEQKNLKNFIREYEFLNNINHRNIIKTYGLNLNGGNLIKEKSCKEKDDVENVIRPAILLKYCPRSLKKGEIIKMSKVEKITVMYEIVEGMKCVHSKGIIHRDLKPENVLIDKKGVVKISDFGISTLMSINTQTQIAGTQKFMAPELLNEDKHYSEKVDNYAFGVLMYFILTDGEYPQIAITQIGLGKKAPIPDSINSISRKIINECWSFLADDRPSFTEIAEEMRNNEYELIELTEYEKRELKEKIKAISKE